MKIRCVLEVEKEPTEQSIATTIQQVEFHK